MKTLLQLLVGAIICALVGGLLGAMTLGAWAYTDTSSGFLGTGRDWAPIAAGVGAAFGGAQGLIIGLVVATTKSRKSIGALIGGVGGMIVYILFLCVTTELDKEVQLMAFCAIPGGAIVGVLGATAVAAIRARQAKLTN